MEINWNFKEITKEIEQLKKWKPTTFEEKTSKYLALKNYENLLFSRTFNDRELEKDSTLKESHAFTERYLNRNKGLNKTLNKIFDYRSQEMLIDFLKLVENHSLEDTKVDIESPLLNKYVNKLSAYEIIKLGDEFVNSIPFLEKNAISELANKGLISLTDADKTIYPSNLGKTYISGHVLSTYYNDIHLNSLINILSSFGHNRDLSFGRSYLEKELKIDNVFVKFFPRLIEMLSMDFIIEKENNLAIDASLSKYKFLTNQNNYLKNTNYILGSNQNYDQIIDDVEKSLRKTASVTKLKELKEKIKNPIPPIFGQPKNPIVMYSEVVLKNGTYLLGTLLAMKFYYLIKEDREKGMDLLKQVSADLVINNTNSMMVLKKYGLEDYLCPDYIKQYNQDYKLEKEEIKRKRI